MRRPQMLRSPKSSRAVMERGAVRRATLGDPVEIDWVRSQCCRADHRNRHPQVWQRVAQKRVRCSSTIPRFTSLNAVKCPVLLRRTECCLRLRVKFEPLRAVSIPKRRLRSVELNGSTGRSLRNILKEANKMLWKDRHSGSLLTRPELWKKQRRSHAHLDASRCRTSRRGSFQLS